MQKTVREWLEELPEPYRSQAMDNLVKYPLPKSRTLFSNIGDALLYGFDWDLTPQGFSYWHRIKHGIIIQAAPTERQTAEALLKEFKEWYNSEFDDYLPVSDDKLQKFLTSKYGKG